MSAHVLMAALREMVNEPQPLGIDRPVYQRALAALAAGESGLLYERAVEVVLSHGRASISLVQRKLQITYTHAAHLLDAMEHLGIIGRLDLQGKREILVCTAAEEPQP